jgi:hypothetical protein
VTPHGVVVVDVVALLLLFSVLRLVRRGRLYVGYGVMFVVLAVATIAIVSVPGVLALVTRLVGAVFPVSALTLVALAIMAFLLVYVLSQLTILANRVATVVQALALERAKADAEHRRRHGADDVP